VPVTVGRAPPLLRARSGDESGLRVSTQCGNGHLPVDGSWLAGERGRIVDEFKKFLDDVSPDQFAAGNE
jgi:hypothetical protein